MNVRAGVSVLLTKSFVHDNSVVLSESSAQLNLIEEFQVMLSCVSGFRESIFPISIQILRKMSANAESAVNLRELFLCGVDAVRPESVFGAKHFRIQRGEPDEERLLCDFDGKTLSVAITGKQCHLVGFGKGVYGMASGIGAVLDERLQSGILSVPIGTVEKFASAKLPAAIRVYEGARDNLPDEAAVSAAEKIVEFARGLSANDVLFVLITGGGSALLPLPCAGVTLAEKCSVIKQLASRGADIASINRVRVDLSQSKGGKLAECAAEAGAVVSFIVSDVIGDSIATIASGPTAPAPADGLTSSDVLRRFDLWHSLPPHIRAATASNAGTESPAIKNVKNVLIANNQMAIRAAVERASALGVSAMFLSAAIEGDVAALSEAYERLADAVRRLQTARIDSDEFLRRLSALRPLLRFAERFASELLETLTNGAAKGICLVGGGEPTVKVVGQGLGGRNQELALRFGRLCFHNDLLQDVQLLSAGTDGIDGECRCVFSVCSSLTSRSLRSDAGSWGHRKCAGDQRLPGEQSRRERGRRRRTHSGQRFLQLLREMRRRIPSRHRPHGHERDGPTYFVFPTAEMRGGQALETKCVNQLKNIRRFQLSFRACRGPRERISV